tara:strand:- start:274 stop:390 length:117 start_codon:yes stop_codon:yes gene_type:complete
VEEVEEEMLGINMTMMMDSLKVEVVMVDQVVISIIQHQ